MGVLILVLTTCQRSSPDTKRILVTEAHVEGLRQEHMLATGSLPTPEEEKRLIENYTNDEVLIREAMQMGLHKGDPIVRRRLVQKMEFLLEDFYTKAEPTDSELQEYLESHRERFSEPARISLTHVFLDRSRHAEGMEASIRILFKALGQGGEAEKLGDPFLPGSRFQRQTKRGLASIFGSGFAEKVFGFSRGEWMGPVESSYGIHLVRIEERTEAREKRLEEVRSRVLREIKAERRREARQAAIRNLRERYEILRLESEKEGT